MIPPPPLRDLLGYSPKLASTPLQGNKGNNKNTGQKDAVGAALIAPILNLATESKPVASEIPNVPKGLVPKRVHINPIPKFVHLFFSNETPFN